MTITCGSRTHRRAGRVIALTACLVIGVSITPAHAQQTTVDVLSFLLTNRTIITGDFDRDAQAAAAGAEGGLVNIKRILAYSSIAHFGYLLVAFLAGGSLGSTAVAFYLVAYFVTNLIAFGVVTILSGRREADEIEDYRGLFWRRPWLATIFLTALLSLGGIPLTAGFMGKFIILMAGVGSALWLLAVILVVNTMISFYYYLRVAFMMFRDAPEGAAAPVAAPSLSFMGGAALAALTLLLVWIGVYPGPLIHTIQSMVAK